MIRTTIKLSLPIHWSVHLVLGYESDVLDYSGQNATTVRFGFLGSMDTKVRSKVATNLALQLACSDNFYKFVLEPKNMSKSCPVWPVIFIGRVTVVDKSLQHVYDSNPRRLKSGRI